MVFHGSLLSNFLVKDYVVARFCKELVVERALSNRLQTDYLPIITDQRFSEIMKSCMKFLRHVKECRRCPIRLSLRGSKTFCCLSSTVMRKEAVCLPVCPRPSKKVSGRLTFSLRYRRRVASPIGDGHAITILESLSLAPFHFKFTFKAASLCCRP